MGAFAIVSTSSAKKMASPLQAEILVIVTVSIVNHL